MRNDELVAQAKDFDIATDPVPQIPAQVFNIDTDPVPIINPATGTFDTPPAEPTFTPAQLQAAVIYGLATTRLT